MMKSKPIKFSSSNINKEPKYWLLISYIYLLQFANTVIILTAFVALYLSQQEHQVAPYDFLGMSLFFSALNIFFLAQIRYWRKWGVWGFTVVNIIATAYIIFSGYPVGQSLLGLSSVVILFVLFHLGGKKKAWNKLK